MLEKIQHCTSHIICTARTKTDYVMEEYVAKNGKVSQRPVKVGLKTEQKEGLDYNFTIVFRLDREHNATAVKTRASAFDNYYDVITEQTGEKILEWLEKGESVKQEQEQEIDLTPIAEKLVTLNTTDELTEYFKTIKPMTNEIKQLFTMRKEAILKGEK